MFASVIFRKGFYPDYRLKLKLNLRESISDWADFCHFFTWFEPICYNIAYSSHLSNRGANMSMSRWGSPSLRASVRQDFMADSTSLMMLLAFTVESIYSPADVSRILRSDSLVDRFISRLWLSASVGLMSYAGESSQPLRVKRKPWLRKWSSELPIMM